MPDEPTTHPLPEPAAPLTPRQRATAIRIAAAEVLTRVQEWRDTPGWSDGPSNRRRYQITADAVVTKLDTLPEPDTDDELALLIDAVRPILTTWRPSRPGEEQAIFVAVGRLQAAINR